ncbi:MAG: hypothetical protein RBR02_06265 [Desulfuromonadaceae bacterium]|nr:hypothetical protein [Desulfuromonadaceae bacterium]
MEQEIKEWYTKTYPDDTEGQSLLPEKTFMGLFEALDRYKDVYTYLFGMSSKGDSLMRERIFKKLAELMEVDYNYVYSQWLSGGN